MSKIFRCIVCKQNFNDHVQAKSTACSGGGGHMLQEMIDGSWNDDSKERADFYAPSPSELREWAGYAKKMGYDIDDT